VREGPGPAAEGTDPAVRPGEGHAGARRRAVKVPRALRFIHGDSPTRLDVFLVYAVGLVFGILAVLFAYSRVASLPAWKAIILFVVAVDVSGGTVAAFSASAGAWYAERPGVKRAFPFLHVVDPALLCVLFDGRVAYWALVFAFTAGAASVVMLIRERSRQEPAAAALVALGTVILLPIGLAAPFLAWFAPIYLVKLVLGYPVNRST